MMRFNYPGLKFIEPRNDRAVKSNNVRLTIDAPAPQSPPAYDVHSGGDTGTARDGTEAWRGGRGGRPVGCECVAGRGGSDWHQRQRIADLSERPRESV